ncbi:MAG: hypothetical protein ACFFBS_09095, partial [Promethearchaeota archaeon]
IMIWDKALCIIRIKREHDLTILNCRSAGINKSTFYRIRRLLINREIIKKTRKGYSLWNYSERASLWDRKKSKLAECGGNLFDLEVDRFAYLTDKKDPKTSWPIPKYDKRESIKGIIVLKKAPELKTASGVDFHPAYDTALLTADSIKNRDRIWWKGKPYSAVNVQEIFDGHNLSYRTALLFPRECCADSS